MSKSEKLRTLIVDDEPLARKTIKILLEEDEDFNIVDECKNGYEAIEVLNNNEIDLLFLDIQMPEKNGFDVLASIKQERMPAVIFVTAYDQYLLKALRLHALDYLLKPFSDEQFFETLLQAKKIILEKRSREKNKQLVDFIKNYLSLPENNNFETLMPDIINKQNYISRIAVPINGKSIFVVVQDIDWIESEDYYVRLHVSDKSFLIRESLNNLESKLNPKQFIRIHRSTIINVQRIKEVEPCFHGDYLLTLINGTKLKLSRSRKDKFKKYLNISF